MDWLSMRAKGRRRMEEQSGEVGNRKEMVIMVRVLNKVVGGQGTSGYDFFRVDLNRDENTAVSQYCPPLLSNTGMGCMFCFGSFIYILAKEKIVRDYNPPVLDSDSDLESEQSEHDSDYECEIFGFRKVAFQIDLNQPKETQQWKPATPPKYTRGSRNGVAFDGKMYFFGPIHIPEVYDGNEWVQLPRPPSEVRDGLIFHPLFPDPSQHRIIMYLHYEVKSFCSIYAFYPYGKKDGAESESAESESESEPRWECIISDFHGWEIVSAFADGVIYSWIGRSRELFGAYEVDKNRWLEVVWSSPYPHGIYSNEFEYEDLLYLGHGLLCLAAQDPAFGDGFRTWFFVFDFKRSGEVITFTHRCSQSYDFPLAATFADFFTLDPFAAAITESEDSSTKPKPANVIQKKCLCLRF